MRHKIAIVKNVLNLRSAYDALAQRGHGVEGMALVHGFTGAGKTTAIGWLVNQVQGVHVRARATWTPTLMLGALMRELGMEPIFRGAGAMVDLIVEQLIKRNRSLFVDEIEHVIPNPKMLESLRDIYDLSKVPVFMIGMAGVDKKLAHRPQLSRRITYPIPFLAADLDDARTLAETVCEVELDDDFLQHLHARTEGSMGLMMNGLAKGEALARANGWRKLTLEKWGNRPLFLGDAVNGSKR